MKKPLLITFAVLASLGILGSGAWIFRDEIRAILPGQGPEAGLTQKHIPRGISRKTSTMGRIREAEKLMAEQYYSLATIELASVMGEKPELLYPYQLLGEIYLRTQDIQKLENLITALQERFPEDTTAHVLWVRKLINQKDFMSALNYIENLGENAPLEVSFYEAVLRALQNNHSRAQGLLERVTDAPILKPQTQEDIQDPPTADPRHVVSSAVSEKAESLEAVYGFFETVAEGENPHLFALMSKALSEHNEAVLALEAAEIAIKEDISYPDAWILRGYALYLLQDYTRALEDLRHAYELDPLRPETHYFLALALQKAGQEEEAVLFFEKSLEHNFPFSTDVQWKLVDIFMQQKKYDRVLDLYKKLIQEDSLDEEGLVTLIHRSIDVFKRPDFALETAREFLEQDPKDILYQNMYGWALIANKEFWEARDILNEAKALDPDYPRTYLNLGLLYEEQSEFTQAQELYKEAYERAKEQKIDTVANLAAEYYNRLVEQAERPESPSAPARPESSP